MRPTLAAAARILATAALFTFSASACRAQDWVEREAGLGLDDFRFLVSGGVNYATAFGSELEHVDPSFGFWASGAYRLRGSISPCISISRNVAGFDGQITQILDVPVRPDGRSGHAVGDVTLMRIGAGVRVDAFREKAWRYRPYAMAEIARTFFDVTLESVDGEPPVDEPDEVRSSFDDSQWGALVRGGVDYRINELVGIDLGATYEFLEFQGGTSALASLLGGASFRF
jgi:hypothetical protein